MATLLSAGRATWARWGLVAALAILLAMDYAQVWSITNNHDFAVFYQAAERLRDGQDIYQDIDTFKHAIESGSFVLKDPNTVWPYAYPPLAAVVLLPLTALPYPLAAAAWTAVNLLFLWAGCALVVLGTGRVTWVMVAAVLLLLIRFYPATVALRLGQLEVSQFLLIALALWALAGRRERLAGISLGVATALKFFPGALLGFLLWKRRWRPAAWGIAVAMGLLAASYAVVGLDSLPRYLAFTSVYSHGGFAAFPYNQSLSGFFTRAFTANLFVTPVRGINSPSLAWGLTALATTAVTLPFLAVTWGPGDPTSERFSLEYALAVVVLLLASPHSQIYAFVWLLLPFIVLVRWVARQGHVPWLVVGGLLIAYLLIGQDFAFNVRFVIRFIQAHLMVGTLVLWGLLIVVLWNRKEFVATQPGPPNPPILGGTRFTPPRIGGLGGLPTTAETILAAWLSSNKSF